jgi:hypothetical protein
MTVVFEFLGSEPIENVITCMNFAVDKVIYFGYHEIIQEQRKKTVDFLNEYCNVQEIEFYSLSHDNLQSILNTMRIKIKNELEDNNQIYFDITGVISVRGFLNHYSLHPIYITRQCVASG